MQVPFTHLYASWRKKVEQRDKKIMSLNRMPWLQKEFPSSSFHSVFLHLAFVLLGN